MFVVQPMFLNFTTLGVITLPVLAPIAALLQLLFPGLLRDQWKQYRVAIVVLLTQSTVFMLHWAAVTWWVKDRVWWLSDAALTFAIVLVALVGLIVAALMSYRRVRLTHRRLEAYHAGQARSAPLPLRERVARSAERGEGKADNHSLAASSAIDSNQIYIPPVPTIHPLAANPVDRPPARVEYIALSIFAALGILWAFYQLANAASPLDQVASVTAACSIALLHLIYRQIRAQRKPKRPIRASTELVFLLALVVSGTALGVYLGDTEAENLSVDRVVSSWPTYRGNKHRTGVVDGSKAPKNPRLLWTFDPALGAANRNYFFHSTPTVVDELLYVGALFQKSAFSSGYLYCINTSEKRTRTDAGQPQPGQPGALWKPGELIWRFSASNLPGGAAKPIFCAPTLHDGVIYFGEGYHEDVKCRLFAADASTGQVKWMVRTSSHTESPPTIFGSRIFFGAGDDGLLCYNIDSLIANTDDPAAPSSPMLLWQAKELHIDGAPCVADNRVFVGTVIGDVHAGLAMLALDASTGDVIWKVDSPLPVPGCAAHSSGRVYFGLGNGKLGLPADDPKGAVWCLDAATGEKKWEFNVTGGVFGCPVIAHGNCYFTCTDGKLYCVGETTGELKWTMECAGSVVGSPVVTDDDVVTITVTGVLQCFAAKDGALRWTFKDEAKIDVPSHDAYASPTLSAGRIYIAAGGKIHCIGD